MATSLRGQRVTGSRFMRHHQMETFSALLTICAGNSPVTGEFPALRPVTRSFDVFFDLCLNKRLSKQWRGRRFETPSRQLWRHCNDCVLQYALISTLSSHEFPLKNGQQHRKGFHLMTSSDRILHLDADISMRLTKWLTFCRWCFL